MPSPFPRERLNFLKGSKMHRTTRFLAATLVHLNGNEKYHELPQSLPGKAAYSGTIQAGDLMLWSSNTLVLFYDAFSTPYRYVRLGRVDDAANLAPALGAGSVKIIFTLDSHSQPAARRVGVIHVYMPLQRH
jgi:hypothetical protein